MSDTPNESDVPHSNVTPAIADGTGGAPQRSHDDDASSLLAKAREQVTAAVSEQKDGIADRIDHLADTVHRSGTQFEGKQDWIASAIDRGSSELGALASSLRENDISTLLEQIRSLAKRQPALFVGLSLAAGFAVARLGKIVAADVSRDDLPTLPEVGHGGK